MSNPYTSQSASGYNSSPPPDDGSSTATNEITWAGIKTKLTDPVKALADAINTAVTSAFGAIFGNSTNAQSANYTVQASDRGKVISCTNSITVALLAAATAGDGFVVIVKNNGTGTVTVDANASETIDGALTQTVGKNATLVLECTGSAWNVVDASGLVLLASATASASATIDFASGIGGGFDEYMLVVTDLVPATDATDLWLRVSEDSGGTFKAGAADYGWSLIASVEGAAAVTGGAAGDTKIVIRSGIGNATGEGFSGTIRFRIPSGAKYKTFDWMGAVYNSTPATVVNILGGIYKGTTNAINGVRLLMSAGNITSGSFALYGVRKP